MHPTPVRPRGHPSPFAEARERGGDRYKSKAFPIHFDFMYASPLPSPVPKAKGEGPGVG